MDEEGNYIPKKIRGAQKKAMGEQPGIEGESTTDLIEEEEDLDVIKSSMPLDEGVLMVNLGIPIIVVCQKADLLVRGEKANMLETNLNFI